ncbi:MAG: alkaline phosphatase [Acidobacteria bacterium]|nr:alkaline phosphatase [Acidobacteriota bacterium]
MQCRRNLLFIALWLLCGAGWVGAQTLASHVIVVGIDGLGSEGLRASKSPNIRKLMKEGSWTLGARGVIPTVSSPNWASMIMGAGPEQHGVVTNEWKVDKHDIEPVCKGTAATFPTVFGVLRQQKPQARIGIFHDWEDFGRLVEPKAATVQRHVKGSAEAMAAAIEWWLVQKPALLFVHLDDVDHAGHGKGWMGPEYMAEIERIDTLVGDLIEAVRKAKLGSSTAIVVTADHGGTGKKHGSNNQKEIEIPWVISGAGIGRAGELNVAVNTYDTAATVAWLLGVRPPACWTGRTVQEALR